MKFIIIIYLSDVRKLSLHNFKKLKGKIHNYVQIFTILLVLRLIPTPQECTEISQRGQPPCTNQKVQTTNPSPINGIHKSISA